MGAETEGFLFRLRRCIGLFIQFETDYIKLFNKEEKTKNFHKTIFPFGIKGFGIKGVLGKNTGENLFGSRSDLICEVYGNFFYAVTI